MTEPAIQQPYEIVGIAKGVEGLRKADQSLVEHTSSWQKFDAEVTKAADRLTNTYVKRSAAAYVKNKQGLDDNTRSANSLRSSLDKLAEVTHKHANAAQATAQATQGAALASGAMASSVQRLLPTFSVLGASIARISPELGAMSTAVGRASGAMGGFTSVLGGPWGIAIGAAVAGLGLLIEWFRSSESAAESAKKAYEENAKALQKMAESEMFLEQQRRDREAASTAGVARRLAAQRQAEAQRRPFVQAELDAVVAYGAPITEEQARAQQERDRKQFDEDLARMGMPDEAKKAKARKDPNDPFLRNQRRDAADAQLRSLDAQINAPSLDERAARMGRDKSSERNEAFLEKMARDDEVYLALKEGHHEKLRALEAETFEGRMRLEKEAAKRSAELDNEVARNRIEKQGMALQSVEAFGRGAIAMAQAAAKGEKISGQMILATIGDTLVGLGTQWLFEGLGYSISSFGVDPRGPLKMSLGGAAIAAGIGMGAASAGAAPSAGGGGGGGGGRSSATPIEASRDSGARNQQPVHVTVQFSSLTPASDEDARRLGTFVRKGINSGALSRDWATGH